MKVRMTVTVTVNASPKEISREDVGEYVLDAVFAWGGQFPPEHPLFSDNVERIRVTGKNFGFVSERTE